MRSQNGNKKTTSKKKFKWLNLNIRVAGLVERGQYGKCILQFLPNRLVRPGAVPPTESKEDIAASNLLNRVQGQAQVMSFRKQKPVQAHSMTDGCKAWASACKARKLNHRAVNHYKMEFVKKDKKPAKSQSKLLGTQKNDRLWQDLKGFLGSKVTSKNNAKEMNPRLKTYVFAYMFRRNADNVWYETGKSFANDVKKKRATFTAVQKIAVSLWENLDFLSKSCVFQHFGFHLFFCIR